MNTTSGVDAFGTLNITSDFQEKDIVFGGDKKLDYHEDQIFKGITSLSP